jgi:regulator of replication initiation timing
MDPLAQALSILATSTKENSELRKENLDLRKELEALRRQLEKPTVAITAPPVKEKIAKTKEPKDPNAPVKEKNPKRVEAGKRIAIQRKIHKEIFEEFLIAADMNSIA